MPYARIYSPSKTAMQQGKAKTGYWVLEYNNCDTKFYDPIMGWTGSNSTNHQVRLTFKNLEAAKDFAESLGLNPIVEALQVRKIQKRSYADNFRHDRPRG